MIKYDHLSIEQLDQNWFHDILIDKIEICNEELLELRFYAEFEKYEWLNLTGSVLVFKNIQSLKIASFELNQLSDLELYSADFEFTEDIFHCKLMLLLGFGQQDLPIELSCRSIESQRAKVH
jgi:hypothetical protein